MNERALNRKELDYLFNKYDDIENINYIQFLGNVAPANVSKKGVNPSFEYIDVNKPGRTGYQTMRMMIEIPSPYRNGTHNQPYKTRIPVFTTDRAAEETLNMTRDGGLWEYVAGRGRLQNYNVVSDIKYNPDFMHLLYTRIVDQLNMPKEKVSEMARALGMLNGQYEKNFVSLTTIWSNSFMDGTEYAKHLDAIGKLKQFNNVCLQGLVYMPPSIRPMEKEEFLLHFKVRIKRTTFPEDQNVPLLFRGDYDYINVVAFGDKCQEWFPKIKQGYPIRVMGRVESSKYRKAKKISDRQKTMIAEKLGIKRSDQIVADIADFFVDHSVPIEFPTFNVWANHIETDIEKIMFEAVPDDVREFIDNNSPRN